MKSDNKGHGGDVAATDGHADSDPKTFHLHVLHPPDTTQITLQEM